MEPHWVVSDSDEESSQTSSRSSRKRGRQDADYSEGCLSDDESISFVDTRKSTSAELERWSQIELETIRMLTSRLNISDSPREQQQFAAVEPKKEQQQQTFAAPPTPTLSPTMMTTDDILLKFKVAVETNGWEWAENLFVRFLQAKSQRNNLEKLRAEENSRDMTMKIKRTSQTLSAAKSEVERLRREQEMLARRYKDLLVEVNRAKENASRQSQIQRDLQRRMEIIQGRASYTGPQ